MKAASNMTSNFHNSEKHKYTDIVPDEIFKALCSEGMRHCLSFISKSGSITMKNRSEKSWAGRVRCGLGDVPTTDSFF